MKLWRRRIALLLTALLLCALLPAAALAEEELDLSANGIDSAADEVEITLDDDSVEDIPEIEPDAIPGIDDLELSLDDAGLEMNADMPEGNLSADEGASARTNATRDVEIREFYFPDETFRNYVKRFDVDGNGVLSVEECAAVEEIDVKDCGISNLKGIKFFSNLKRLDCSHNQLAGLDLGECMDLTVLDCSHNQLSHLYLNRRPALTKLSCSNNRLIEELDLIECTALTELSCFNNQLERLNLSGCTALKELSCSNNQLIELNLSGCTALTELSCSNNHLAHDLYMYLRECKALKEVDCSHNQLISMPVNYNTALESLDCSHNQLEDMTVNDNTALESLDCSNNQIEYLTLCNNTALESVDCSNNRMSDFLLSNCPAVKKFLCFNNRLSKLDLHNWENMKELSCANNQLESLDLNENEALESLDCSNNKLGNLYVKFCSKLSILVCHGNELDYLDIWYCEALKKCVKEGKCEYTSTKKTYSIGAYRLECDPGVNLVTESKPQREPRQVSVRDCEIEDIAAQTYSGRAIRPAPVVKYGGKTLKRGTDYTLSYAGNRAIGTATVTIKGRGDYTGSVERTFDINPKAVRLCSVKAGKKKLTVKWKKGPGGVKYEVQYSLKEDFSVAKTVRTKKTSTVSMAIKNLKSKNIYYVRVRAFKVVNGRNYASEWSKAYSKKVK